MFLIRKLHKHSTALGIDIPAMIVKQIGLKQGDDVMFEFQPGGKEIVLTKSPYEKVSSISRRIWTGEEIDLLKDLCKSGITASDLADRFGRSQGTIRGKARKLGLKIEIAKIFKPWSSEDEKLLMELFRGTSNRKLVKLFGRPLESVKGKAYSLGLCKGKKPSLTCQSPG